MLVLNNYSSRSREEFKKVMNLDYTVMICTHLLATSDNEGKNLLSLHAAVY